MNYDPALPYQQLPDLPPDTELETKAVLKAVVDASRELASLNMACRRMPDPTLLINLTPLIEAQASSQIENIVTTNDELFRAASGALEDVTPAIKEALRYREALRVGFELVKERPLTTQTAKAVCSMLHGSDAQIRNTSGTYIGNPMTQLRVYTPPEGHDLIAEKLFSWESFIHDHGDLDPLIAMALQHYQFEAIHPFYDGNGRTGRILNLLCLQQYGLLSLPVLYMSGYLVRHKDEYYSLLKAVTAEGRWEDWVIFIATAVAESARSALQLIDKVLEHRDLLEHTIRATHPKMHAAELARILTSQPYARIDDVVNAGLAQRVTASKWLQLLAEDGLIRREKMGRSVLFINTALVQDLFGQGLVAQ
ncbi:Fic family protein [Tessaracoccus lubricantis]